MPAARATIAGRLALLTVLTPLLTGLSPGCGPGTLDVDKAAFYTPESLASEFALRFHRLSPEAQAAALRYVPKPKDEKKIAAQLARSEQAKNKLSGGAPARKKQTAPPNVDDLVADIDNKLDLINGMSRADACRRMIDTISADAAIPDNDKKRLTELVGQMDGSR
jgi:hypothetical protein